MTLFLLSLTGIPPLAGFFAKVYVILAAVQAGGWLASLAVLAVLNAAAAAFYYLRVVVYMYMREPATEQPPLPHGRLLWGGLTAATVAHDPARALPGPALEIVGQAAPALTGWRRRPADRTRSRLAHCDALGRDVTPGRIVCEALGHDVRPDAAEGAGPDDPLGVDPEVDRQGGRAPGRLGGAVGVEADRERRVRALRRTRRRCPRPRGCRWPARPGRRPRSGRRSRPSAGTRRCTAGSVVCMKLTQTGLPRERRQVDLAAAELGHDECRGGLADVEGRSPRDRGQPAIAGEPMPPGRIGTGWRRPRRAGRWRRRSRSAAMPGSGRKATAARITATATAMPRGEAGRDRRTSDSSAPRVPVRACGGGFGSRC